MVVEGTREVQAAAHGGSDEDIRAEVAAGHGRARKSTSGAATDHDDRAGVSHGQDGDEEAQSGGGHENFQ